MGCNCGGGSSEPNNTPAGQNQQQEFVVTLPDGSKKTVTGEHAAKVEVTMAGGGTYSRV